MQPEERDAAYLWDMLRASEEVVSFVKDKSWKDYQASDLLRSAVERKVQIIGEAARHVSRKFQAAHPHIPWNPIIVQRHRLVHEYGAIRHERIWNVATVHVPVLITHVRALLPSPPPMG
jgi:uncharacterized protein with HEPN domain